MPYLKHRRRQTMAVQNIIFDIGNVLVQWAPQHVVQRFFPQEQSPDDLTRKLFKSPVWIDLNLGKLTEKEALQLYHQQLTIPLPTLEKLMIAVKESLMPVEGSFELLDELYRLHLPLYSITDNVKEIITYLKGRYDFFPKFLDMVVSAEVGALKPSAVIYKHLIDTHSLIPQQTVFIDDHLPNIQGAKDMGLQTIHFTTAAQCRAELKSLGVHLK